MDFNRTRVIPEKIIGSSVFFFLFFFLEVSSVIFSLSLSFRRRLDFSIDEEISFSISSSVTFNSFFSYVCLRFGFDDEGKGYGSGNWWTCKVKFNVEFVVFSGIDGWSSLVLEVSSHRSVYRD